jgi:hypothetical protein
MAGALSTAWRDESDSGVETRPRDLQGSARGLIAPMA